MTLTSEVILKVMCKSVSNDLTLLLSKLLETFWMSYVLYKMFNWLKLAILFHWRWPQRSYWLSFGESYKIFIMFFSSFLFHYFIHSKHKTYPLRRLSFFLKLVLLVVEYFLWKYILCESTTTEFCYKVII